MSVIDPAVKAQTASVGLSLFRKAEEYFQDRQHRKDFETWYKKTYGKPYVWKKA